MSLRNVLLLNLSPASCRTLHALLDSKGLSSLMMIAMVCQQLVQGFFCVPCIHIANVQNAHAKTVFVLGISVFPPF